MPSPSPVLLFDSILAPDILESVSKYLSLAQENALGTTIGTLGLGGLYVLYKSIQQSRSLCALPGPAPASPLWGHTPEIFDPLTGATFQDHLLKTYGATCRMKGFMGEDVLWTADPRAMHEMVIKEHDNFRGSEGFLSWVKLIGGRNILTAQGEKHKLQRKLLNPVFTVTHLRELVPTFASIVGHLESIVIVELMQSSGSTGTVDMYKWVHYVSLEMIGQGGKCLGYSFGIMEGKKSEYLDAAGRLLPSMFRMWYMRPFLKYLVKFGPRNFRRFIVEHTPFSHVQDMKEISDAMNEVTRDIYRQKKEAHANGTLHEQVAAGKDIMTLLLKQNELLPSHEQMTEEDIMAQLFGLIFAGSDSTSTSLARTLELLAHHPDIQASLHAEIHQAYQIYGTSLDYDQLNSLTLLDAVCRESLRLRSPVLGVERVAQKDWTLPLQYPVKSSDGKRMVEHVVVKKGTNVHISICAANLDKHTWGDDAEEFRPSRWLKDLPSTVKESKTPGVYSSIMTFWGGPRACIGFKFSQLEMKMVLVKLIGSFKFEPSEEKIVWSASETTKPHVVNKDGTWKEGHSMPMKVTVIGDAE